jgi:hypothetical protein
MNNLPLDQLIDRAGFISKKSIPNNPVDTAQVIKLYKWIRDNLEPSLRINRDMNSYSLKHFAESKITGIGEYVSNGDLIYAMISVGYSYENSDGLNAFFGISKKSTNKLYKMEYPT